jgi:hypothetical protein
VAFTVPALATVGFTEEAVRRQRLRFQTHYQDTSEWFTARRAGETVSGHKVLVEDESQRILGAHLLGPHAEEVINIFAVAVRFGIRADELKQMLFAYPTSASDVVHMSLGNGKVLKTLHSPVFGVQSRNASPILALARVRCHALLSVSEFPSRLTPPILLILA